MNTTFKNRGNGRGEIWLYGPVGETMWGDGISARSFSKELAALNGVDQIDLHVNSEGGSVFEGLAIYNLLKNHKARVVVSIDGWAASIASVIALAGDEIRIAANGWMMIHNPSGMAWGDSAEMRKTADLLDQIKGSLVDTYIARTGKSEKDVVAWMDEETWFDARAAVDNGFAHVITDELQMAAHFDLSKFRNAPRAVHKAQQSAPVANRHRVKIAEMGRRAGAPA